MEWSRLNLYTRMWKAEVEKARWKMQIKMVAMRATFDQLFIDKTHVLENSISLVYNIMLFYC